MKKFMSRMTTMLSILFVCAAMLTMPILSYAAVATQNANLTITASPVNPGSVTGWMVEKKVGTGAYAQLGANLPVGATTLTDSGLPGGTAICYRATALSTSFGNSAPGTEACINTGGTPGSPTISVTITLN